MTNREPFIPEYSTFAERIGQEFVVQSDGNEAVPLRLAALHGDPPKGTGAAHGFSVMFHGSDQVPLSQGTYDFENSEVGRFTLFIVPVGIDAESLVYEAVFTRLASP